MDNKREGIFSHRVRKNETQTKRYGDGNGNRRRTKRTTTRTEPYVVVRST